MANNPEDPAKKYYYQHDIAISQGTKFMQAGGIQKLPQGLKPHELIHLGIVVNHFQRAPRRPTDSYREREREISMCMS